MPALKATVRGHQGMLVIMRLLKVRGLFCRTCGIAVHREMTTKTLWQGWWGIASFVIAPVTLIINLVARVRFGRMTPPVNGLRPPLDPGKPVIRRVGALGVFAPFLIVGALAIGAELDDSANTAKVGACMHISGTESAPEATVVDCGSTEAQFKVAERYEGSDAHCDRTVYSEYAEYGGQGSFTLCLTPLP
ncbi:LppU/SCO3897 family protein [Streptomyces sp. NPDC003343]|uniref:LppU/SCO3897 family protein n=1 Tax=Streptomyces sp. EKR5.2 TaxID=3461014 RepID=UPI004041421B